MGSEHAHAIEVVDLETGAVRYINSGSHIAFIEGQITDIRSQNYYNEATEAEKMSSDGQGDVSHKGNGGRKSKKATGKIPKE